MTTERAVRRSTVALLAAALAACSSQPPAPDWQATAKAASERAITAYLAGNARVEAAELARARSEVSRTGRADLLARVELAQCAAQVASLVFGPCAAFEPLRADAPPAERAYAAYLTGQASAADTALLPAQHRSDSPATVADPLARLIAAGVRFQAGRADPALVALAVDTASAQGWRRPLLAWLGVQLRLAEQNQQVDEAARLKRRIALAAGTPGP